jgi:hypothetical protein
VGQLTAENYEIRLLGPEGGTMLMFSTNCVSDAHARDIAHKIFSSEYIGYEIWCGKLCIEKYSRPAKGG